MRTAPSDIRRATARRAPSAQPPVTYEIRRITECDPNSSLRAICAERHRFACVLTGRGLFAPDRRVSFSIEYRGRTIRRRWPISGSLVICEIYNLTRARSANLNSTALPMPSMTTFTPIHGFVPFLIETTITERKEENKIPIRLPKSGKTKSKAAACVFKAMHLT